MAEGQEDVLAKTFDLFDSLSNQYQFTGLLMERLKTVAKRGLKNLYKTSKAGEGMRAMITTTLFNGYYELVKLGDTDVFYYRTRQYNPDRPLDAIFMQRINREQLDDIVKTWHKRIFPDFFESSELRRSCNTVYENIEEKIVDIDNDYIAVADDMFYDSVNHAMVTAEGLLDEETQTFPRVYRKMFSSTRVSNDQVQVPPLTKEQVAILMDEYNDTLAALARGKFPQNIEEINDWACGDEEIYRDIIYMYSTAFMKEKPLGVFFPVGIGRNGKSSCMDLWASLVGTDYAARVPLDKLGEKHFVHSLKNAVINIPDETNEDYIKDQAAFRMVAAHSTYEIEKMASNEPLKLHCRFMMACPSNHVPKWTGDSAEACVKRTKAIPFNADFSDSDLTANSWGQEHFTPDFMARLAGQVLAYASYFSTHDWEETATMVMERQGIEEEAAAQFVYFRLWSKLFDGFEHFDTVKKDFENWCRLRDIGGDIPEIKRGDLLWRKYSRSGAINPQNKKEYHVYRKHEPGSAKIVMFDEMKFHYKHKDLMDGKRLIDYHEFGGSIIYDLEEEDALKTDGKRQLELRLNNG